MYCTCGDTLGDVDYECRVHFPSRSGPTRQERELAELLYYWLKRVRIGELDDADLQRFRDTHKLIDGIRRTT